MTDQFDRPSSAHRRANVARRLLGQSGSEQPAGPADPAIPASGNAPVLPVSKYPPGTPIGQAPPSAPPGGSRLVGKDAAGLPPAGPAGGFRPPAATTSASGRPTVAMPSSMRKQPQQPALPPSSLGLPSAGLPPAVGIPSAGMPPADVPPGGPPAANWPPVRSYANEPTDQLPLVPTSVPALPPGAEPARLAGKRPPPPRVAGRAVLVYEPQVKKPWRLWVFTAVLVSLTVGVILGQAEAYQPATNRSSAGTVGVVPVPAQPTGATETGPVAGPPPTLISAPLGQIKTRQLEVTGNAALLRFRTADLGDVLFNISGLDASTSPAVTDTKGGTALAITPTGAPGTVGAEIVLSTKVAWTVKLTAGTSELDLDSRAGGIAGLEIAGGVARSVLQLPKPKGTVPLTVSGAVGELTVRTEAGAPVRVRLGKGAGTATVDGRTSTAVKAGSTLTENGWRSAKNRYDVKTTGDVTTLIVDRLVNGR